MTFDRVLRNARLSGQTDLIDIGIAGETIAAIGRGLPAGSREEDLGGCLAVPGFVDSHIHLDKSCLLERCPCRAGALAEAVADVARAKRAFTVEDVTERATRTLEKAILQGTTQMRSHVDVDPRVGLTSFEALRALRKAYHWAIDIQICVFPQEGLTNDPGCEALLAAALRAGADVIGGAPYTDTDPAGQLTRIFDLARTFDVDIDLHLDFDLDPSRSDMEEVCRLTDSRGWGGRVTIGHATKLSAMPSPQLDPAMRRLADAGVAVTVLPATDLFLGARGQDHNVPRGVAPAHRLSEAGVLCSLATNNVLNPFTPFGDCSLLRMANLYANIAQIGTADDLDLCFDMITSRAARLMNIGAFGIEAGHPADIVVLDCQTAEQAVRELAQPLLGLKRGRQSFRRTRPELMPPGACLITAVNR